MMLTLLKTVLLPWIAMTALQGSGEGQGEFVPMRDGEILVGEITSHDEEGLDVKRLDNGGVVRLRWSQLAPPFERSLRLKLGYIYEQEEETLVDADEITLADGTKRVGRIVSQAPDQIVLKDSRSTLTYARSILQSAPARVRVPALDVYTKDELYTDKAATFDLTTPQGNKDLARYLEQINDFGRSIQHWNEVKKLDAAFHPGEVAEALKRLEIKKARQDEIDFLTELESQRKQRHFDKALAMCDDFAKKFPASTAAARADVEKRKKNITEDRHIEQINKTWIEYHRQVDIVLRSKASDRRITLEDARSYARGGDVRKDVLAATLKTLQKTWSAMTEQELTGLWKERGKRAKFRTVSYGAGTFILGKDAAKKNVVNMIGGVQGAQSKVDPAADAMMRKLQALLQKQQSPQTAADQKKLDPQEEWWQIRATPFERRQFLIALFVEFSGEMQDQVYRARPCNNCGGLGALPVTVSLQAPSTGGGGGGGRGGNNNQQQPAGGVSYQDCTSCHGVGFERLITYH